MGTDHIKKACTIAGTGFCNTCLCDLESSIPPLDRGFKPAAMTDEACLAPTVICVHLRHLRITPPHPDPLPKDPLPDAVEAPNSPSVPTHAPLVHALPDTAPRPPA